MQGEMRAETKVEFVGPGKPRERCERPHTLPRLSLSLAFSDFPLPSSLPLLSALPRFACQLCHLLLAGPWGICSLSLGVPACEVDEVTT